MRNTLNYSAAAEIFNRWVFTLSAKNCAVENERSAPTLRITVGAQRGGGSGDDGGASGGGTCGDRDGDGASGAGVDADSTVRLSDLRANGGGRVAQWTPRSTSFAQEHDPLIPCSINTMSQYMASLVTTHPGVDREMLHGLIDSGSFKVQEAIDQWVVECKRNATLVAAAAAEPEHALPLGWTDESLGVIESQPSEHGLVRLQMRAEGLNGHTFYRPLASVGISHAALAPCSTIRVKTASPRGNLCSPAHVAPSSCAGFSGSVVAV